MKNIKAQMQFVKMLAEDLLNNAEENLKNREKAQNRYFDKNYMNKNCGVTVLKRKITFLRQELMNLKSMLEKE